MLMGIIKMVKLIMWQIIHLATEPEPEWCGGCGSYNLIYSFNYTLSSVQECYSFPCSGHFFCFTATLPVYQFITAVDCFI